MKSNYVAFGIWESNESDWESLLYNAQLLRHSHPSWKIIIYHDQSVPDKVLTELDNLDVILADMSRSGMRPPLWKFLAADLPDAGYVVFRDGDTGFSLDIEEDWLTRLKREAVASSASDDVTHTTFFKEKSVSVLSYICSLMAPVLDYKRYIGGF